MRLNCLTSKFLWVVLETSMYFSEMGIDSSLGEWSLTRSSTWWRYMKFPDVDQKSFIASPASGYESWGCGRDPSDSPRKSILLSPRIGCSRIKVDALSSWSPPTNSVRPCATGNMKFLWNFGTLTYFTVCSCGCATPIRMWGCALTAGADEGKCVDTMVWTVFTSTIWCRYPPRSGSSFQESHYYWKNTANQSWAMQQPRSLTRLWQHLSNENDETQGRPSNYTLCDTTSLKCTWEKLTLSERKIRRTGKWAWTPLLESSIHQRCTCVQHRIKDMQHCLLQSRISMSVFFSSASGHSTHCWAYRPLYRDTDSLVVKASKPIHL